MGEWTVKWSRWEGFFRAKNYMSDIPADVPLLSDGLAQLLITYHSTNAGLTGSGGRLKSDNPAEFSYKEVSKFANDLFAGIFDNGHKISDMVKKLTEDDLDRFRRFVAWAARTHWAQNNVYRLIPMDEVPQNADE
ncbi:hypothetical protein BCF44_101254 [Kutzneria buriramensis]|uniref:Uncharacterized protein n=2 Tax=Kutzneria buriramensis TaxID=1045776 RepID=A0A3E0I9A6_9PSEU|nr:hypothetical protein BCF44_101254 [Kutzneria buriramensis]